MAKRIQVGGRIESKEVGGIVTGAAEILDDAKGKKQSVINGETDDELLRLDQSKQDNLTFDNAPTEGSDNPVKSGGVYAAQQAILLAIAAINELIPSAASTLNQLADKAFVNSSISTNTATFRGTSAAGLNEQQFLAWANGLEHDLNDYVFWQTSDAAGNTLFKRYKWNGTEWAYEYTLNNSTFTAEQWEAIQSGITALLVAKLRALPTAEQLIQSFDSKQNVLTFDNVPTLGSTNPVKSSGIFNAIKEVSDALDTFISETEALIPAEATAQNQLADKADVAAKIVAAIPSWKGQYDALTDLQAVTGAKAGDMGCVKTTDSDGHAVLTFYQYSAQGAWVVYYTLRHYAQNKPATTGTTGDYPYNGMGRIELQKNIVNGVNTLTQAMLTQQNTIYVIQYDFTLGEDITVPANCVLQFDGGSISDDGTHTISGTPMIVNKNDKQVFYNVDIDIANNYANVVWFGAKGDNLTDNTDVFNYVFNKYLNVYIPNGYYQTGTINLTESFGNVSRHIKGDGIYSSPATNNKNFTRLIYTGTDWLIKCSNVLRFENTIIERLCFDIPTVCEGALYLNDIYYSTFKYIYVLGNGITTTKNIGICINGEGFNNTFDHVIITYVNKGIYIPYSGADDYINTTTIGVGSNGSVYIGKATVGVEIQKGGVFFNGCTIENCSTAIKFNEVIQNTYGYIQSNISNCYFERNETVINVVSLSVDNKLPLIVINNSELHNNTQVVTKSGSSNITFRNVAGVVRLDNALVMNPTQNSASKLEDSPYESYNRIQYEAGKTTQFHSQDVIHSIGPKSNDYDSNAYTSVKSSSMFLTYIPKRVVDLMFATPDVYYHTILLHKSNYSFPNNNGLYKIRLFITRKGDSNADSGGLDFNSDTCIVDLYANIIGALNGYEVTFNKTWFDSMFSNIGIQWSPSSAATRKNLVLTLTVKSNPTAPDSGLLIMYEIDSYGMFGLQRLIQNFGSESIALERTNVISWADSFYDWTKLKWLYKENNSRIWKDSNNNIIYDFSS